MKLIFKKTKWFVTHKYFIENIISIDIKRGIQNSPAFSINLFFN